MVRQQVDPRDASERVESSTNVVRLPVANDLFANFTLASQVLTPNGDGANDDLRIAVDGTPRWTRLLWLRFFLFPASHLGIILLVPPLWGQPLFVDATEEAGLTLANTFGGADKRYIVESTGSGAAFFDGDDDGDLDLYIVNGSTFETYANKSGPGNMLYRNQGDGWFEEVTGAGGASDRGWGGGVAVGDFDNDGYRDLYVTNYGPNALYRNRGDGTFAQAKAGVTGADYSVSAAFFDYDRDGDLDLYVVNYVVFDLGAVPADAADDEPCIYLGGIRVFCGPQGMEGAGDVLYRNDGDGLFAEVTRDTGVEAAGDYYGLGVVPADFNDDGYMDLFVANDQTPNVLFKNNGDGHFADVAPLVGVAYNGDGQEEASMGVDAGDYDGDGDVDFYVSNFYRESNTLYRNDGGDRFADVTETAGLAAPTLDFLGWGTQFFDYDNDGDLDLFAANGHVYPQVEGTGADIAYAQSNQLFANAGEGRFVEVTHKAGPGMQIVKASRGTCIGDYDNDGDIDVFVVELNDVPTLLRNDGGNQRNGLMVQVVGEGSNRDGVGAKIRVSAESGSQWRTVNGASGYLGHSDIRAHFGLGQERQVDVEITWSDGEKEWIRGIAANRWVMVRQGQGYAVRNLPKHAR